MEALYALRTEGRLHGLVIEDSAEGEAPMPPLFYLGQWDLTVVPWTDAKADLGEYLGRLPLERRPDVVLFIGEEDLEERKRKATQAMGPLHEVARAEPGLVDRVVHWLNPVNRNETIVIMRTGPAMR